MTVCAEDLATCSCSNVAYAFAMYLCYVLACASSSGGGHLELSWRPVASYKFMPCPGQDFNPRTNERLPHTQPSACFKISNIQMRRKTNFTTSKILNHIFKCACVCIYAGALYMEYSSCCRQLERKFPLFEYISVSVCQVSWARMERLDSKLIKMLYLSRR